MVLDVDVDVDMDVDVDVELDVDTNDDIYSFFRRKKIEAGIPAILAYKKGNVSIGPNHSVLGSNVTAINNLFQTCVKELVSEKKLHIA